MTETKYWYCFFSALKPKQKIIKFEVAQFDHSTVFPGQAINVKVFFFNLTQVSLAICYQHFISVFHASLRPGSFLTRQLERSAKSQLLYIHTPNNIIIVQENY